MTAILTTDAYPKGKTTKLSYGDLLNIQLALKSDAKSYRDVDMKEDAKNITRTLKKISAIMSYQVYEKKKK